MKTIFKGCGLTYIYSRSNSKSFRSLYAKNFYAEGRLVQNQYSIKCIQNFQDHFSIRVFSFSVKTSGVGRRTDPPNGSVRNIEALTRRSHMSFSKFTATVIA